MNITALKKEVKKNIDKADERVLRLVNALLIADQEKDWYDELPEEVKADLEISMHQESEGKLMSHQSVLKKIKHGF